MSRVFNSMEEMEQEFLKHGFEVFEIEGDRGLAIDTESYSYIYDFSLIKENGLIIIY